MAMLTKGIVQALGRSPGSTLEPKRLVKIPNLATLIDSQDPTFENWRIQVRDKLPINTGYFPTKDARMAFVFTSTGGDA